MFTNSVPRRDLQQLAITTHKAQGSEYDTIVYILNKSSFFVHLRANFTAIFCARERLLIGISDPLPSEKRTKPFVPRAEEDHHVRQPTRSEKTLAVRPPTYQRRSDYMQ
jgi:hypothetical protein